MFHLISLYLLFYLCKASYYITQLYSPSKCSPSFLIPPSSESSSSCDGYYRCLVTHRCPLGYNDYNLVNQSINFYTQKFLYGASETIPFFLNFEDWKQGIYPFQISQLQQNNEKTRYGWTTWDFPLLGTLELDKGILRINTTDGTIQGDCQVQGNLNTTFYGTNVAVYNFLSIYLGEQVKVKIYGDKPLVLLSRSSMIIDTELRIPPGMLGGFQGGGIPNIYNTNGIGSNNVFVYYKTILVYGDYAPEIQEIHTFIDNQGENIEGYFSLQYEEESTGWLPYNIAAEKLQNAIETSLLQIGKGVTVEERSASFAYTTGHIWRIIFNQTIGDLSELKIETIGMNQFSHAKIVTIQNGTSLGGEFALRMFNRTSNYFQYNIKAEELENGLKEDWKDEIIYNIHVDRREITNVCRNGKLAALTMPQEYPSLWQRMEANVTADLCSISGNGHGYIWTIRIETDIGNVSPVFPTQNITIPSPEKIEMISTKDVSSYQEQLQSIATYIMPSLEGNNYVAVAYDTLQYSLAYGGAGGSMTSAGGDGYINRYGKSINLMTDDDLLGGNGGSGGGVDAEAMMPFLYTARGGDGGGVVYLNALNDITLGANGRIVANGAPGTDAYEAAGGGSGGRIVLECLHGSITIMGEMIANGGTGGNSSTYFGGGGAGGVIDVRAGSLNAWQYANMTVFGGTGIKSNGSDGSLVIKSGTDLSVRIDPLNGSMGTSKSLLLIGNGDIKEDSSARMSSSSNIFYAFNDSSPSRISYFVKVGSGEITRKSGAILRLHKSQTSDSEVMIGVGIVNGYFSHGSNFYGVPKLAGGILVEPNRWYKVDIIVIWTSHSYDVRIDGVSIGRNQSFQGDSMGGISLSNINYQASWFDEIYIGNDYTLGFKCPVTDVTGTLISVNPNSRIVWPRAFSGPATSYWPKTKFTSQLSQRAYYQSRASGMLSLDGQEHPQYINDIKESTFNITASKNVSFSQILSLSVENNTDDELKEIVYWYDEVIYNGKSLIGSCSSIDQTTWQNEGIMLFGENITSPDREEELHGNFPKVVVNPTGLFVMWLQVDNLAKSLGLIGVATSIYPNGPFDFARSFYPKAPEEAPGGVSINEVREHNILVSDDRLSAYLVRSYYKSVEYFLPRAVMLPQWEMIANSTGQVDDFGLNYHRAYFHKGYDDKDDIYLQRWRLEDRPWNISCCDTNGLCTYNTQPPETKEDITCPEGTRKTVLGQAQPQYQTISSRFKDPEQIQTFPLFTGNVFSRTSWGEPVYNTKSWNDVYDFALSTNITKYAFVKYSGKSWLKIMGNNNTTVMYPPVEESAVYINATDDDIMDEMFGELGVPISNMYASYQTYDLKLIDQDLDGKVNAAEVAAFKANNKSIDPNLFQKLLTDYSNTKHTQLVDVDGDGRITYTEFVHWIGKDPDIIFDMYDLDKSGLLDENELNRFLYDHQIPRTDGILILLDPNFVGTIAYGQFERWIKTAADYVYQQYDTDLSNTLDVNETLAMQADIGEYFTNTSILSPLFTPNENGSLVIRKDTYSKWLVTSTSLTHDVRNALKIDNAIHATPPDQLVGPLYVGETRRAKYIALYKLNDEFTFPMELTTEIEGDVMGAETFSNIAEFPPSFFGLNDSMTSPTPISYAFYLSSQDLRHHAWYWNGAYWEERPTAPALALYGEECQNIAGNDIGCPSCEATSIYESKDVLNNLPKVPDIRHCDNQKEMDAYIKSFDRWVPASLRFQEEAQYGTQGYQPHSSPCFNQTQHVPCDIDPSKVEYLEISNDEITQWERNKNNRQSSQKIRASEFQTVNQGATRTERFPTRTNSNSQLNLLPDQEDSLLGGGK